METENAISLLSVGVALISALWAFQSRNIAKSALKIAKIERNAKESNAAAHLFESFYATVKGERYYFFSLLITNRSELNDSVYRIELVVNYLSGSSYSNVVLGAEVPDFEFKNFDRKLLSIEPVDMSARGSSRGWFCFKLPSSLLEVRIDSYCIEILLASEQSIKLEPKIIGELIEE